uniref:Homing endonuclease LAGLIDADG domain-containing protein n=1 Tax=Halimeda discoidea TaxID=118222 RepID=A0A1C9JB48_9CHLO|nr:hypothetical protein [Halimeda discoidea]
MQHKKLNIRISRELRDILHGYIMSEGQVTPSGSVLVDQSTKQRLFVEWLYEKLQLLRTNTPIRNRVYIDKRSGNKSYSLQFQTRSICKGFRYMWYKSKRKSLPSSIDCFFSIPFVTVWFAGDGTKMIGQRGAKFEVTCFTPEERLKLKQLFKTKFNINAKILRAGQSKTGTSQWTLSICAPEYDKFRTLITQMDLISRIFPYKLCKK